MKRQAVDKENISENYLSHSGLTSRMYKEFSNSTVKKANNTIKKMSKGLKETLHQGAYKDDKRMKR